jgi:hypothetical protein
MSGRSSFLSQPWRVLRWVGLAAAVPALWACTSRTLEAPVVTPTQTFTNRVVQKVNNNLDILFMVDNSSSMTSMQQKLLNQLPIFMQVLQALPMGLPSVHIAVVSSDMGAPSDQGNAIGCDNTGQAGAFQVSPRGTCTSNDFNVATDTWISDSASGMEKNFTDADPAGIAKVFQCIALLGSSGCGFEHQLASIDHALGSDNPDGNGKAQPPGTNAGFVRDGAYLGIVMLTNEDDCSAPANTTLFSLNAGAQNLSNPLGPIANYRCNQFGHLCGNPPAAPPLNPPAGATTVALDNCVSNDDGSYLIPVSTFVSHIKSLKTDPGNQILVAAVTGPTGDPLPSTTPYTVQWVAQNTNPPESWPAIEHSCGPTGDMSFADPAIRITQFVNSFSNGVLASICDDSYQASMSAIAAKIGALIKPKCVAGTIQQDANMQPNCTVTNEIVVSGVSTNVNIASCASNGNVAPCWALQPPNATNNCAAGTKALVVSTDPNNPNPDSLDSLIQCSTCIAGISAAGCACTGTNDVSGCI